jgi:hypothetical protein
VEKVKKVNRNEKWSEQHAAGHLGVSLSHVQYLLSLVEAPKEANKIKKLERFPAARNLGINDHYLRSLLSIKLVEMKG